MTFNPSSGRYETMSYRRCGRSGLDLPVVALGLWQNFGGSDVFETGRSVIRHAFDQGVTHFDLANNYGPPYGSAEENFGRVMAADLGPFRDELVISSKAGYDMWPGPYGNWGSRKYLIASLDQSLRRLGLDYVDIFYHHRPDPKTPVAESMGALADIVRQGKALYIGISSYDASETETALAELARLGVPCLVHQPRYSLLDRAIEPALLPLLTAHGVGCAVFSPLAQGLLTSKYLGGIPEGSRASRGASLHPSMLSEATLERIGRLNTLAGARGQSLAQMAIAWVLRDPAVTTALVGARSISQLDDTLAALRHPSFSEEELMSINSIAPE